MIISVHGLAGQTLQLDFSKTLGERTEIECFHFITPPIEFRLTRNGTPLQEWQAGNTDMYDLQHPPGTPDWCRDGHRFVNDLQHRHDVATCGVLSHGLAIETTGLGFHLLLLVWPRESTIRQINAASLRIIQSGAPV